jgi:hypothetical protein
MPSQKPLDTASWYNTVWYFCPPMLEIDSGTPVNHNRFRRNFRTPVTVKQDSAFEQLELEITLGTSIRRSHSSAKSLNHFLAVQAPTWVHMLL